MEAFKGFQRAEVDNAIFQAKNSLIGIINEIVGIGNGAVDDNAFMVLCNDVLHKIDETFATEIPHIKTSSFAAKKVFLETVIDHFAGVLAQLKQDNAGNNDPDTKQILSDRIGAIETTFLDLLAKKFTDSDLNGNIDQLGKMLEQYSGAAILTLAIKNGELAAKKVAETYNTTRDDIDEAIAHEDITITRTTDLEGLRTTPLTLTTDAKAKQEASIGVIKQAIKDNVYLVKTQAKLWTLPPEEQTKINEVFLKKFADINNGDQDKKELPQYLTAEEKEEEDIQHYETKGDDLNNLACRAYTNMCKSRAEDKYQADLEQLILEEETKRKEIESDKTKETIVALQQFLVQAERAPEADKSKLQAQKEDLKIKISRLQDRSLQVVKEGIQQSSRPILESLNCVDKVVGTAAFTNSTDSAGIPADIIVACDARFSEAKAQMSKLNKLIDKAVASYQIGMKSQDNAVVKQQLDEIVNDISHAIRVIIPIKESTTGSSRFF